MPDTDVVIVNYRPDACVKLGIDYSSLSQTNPRLIYCENTAFGTRGPQATLPGYDIIVKAMSGLMAAEGKTENGAPLHIFTPVVDVATGLAMAWAVCAALYARERTGIGRRIEASLLATALGHARVEIPVDGSRGWRSPGFALLEELDILQNQGRTYEEVQAHYQAYHAPLPETYTIARTGPGTES